MSFSPYVRADYERACSKAFLAIDQLQQIAVCLGEESAAEDCQSMQWTVHALLEASVRKPNGRTAFSASKRF